VDATFNFSTKTVTFYTDHFSTYVIGTSTSKSGTTPNHDTENSNMPVIPLALLGTGSAAVIAFPKRKRTL